MKSGFTLVEMLVVIAISALLAGIALSYNGASRKEIALSVEEAKISQLILQAESLSIATYGSNANPASPVCGYGMIFDSAAQTYGIFEYHPTAADEPNTCRDVLVPITAINPDPNSPNPDIRPYSAGTWDIHVAPEVRISTTAPDSIGIVLFYPPTPTTYISLSSDESTFLNPTPQTSKVYLTTVDGNDSRVITVNPAGQVSF
jgi:prepilin-type N-terminal cleavage/methylation domain-containing protein